MTDCAEAYKESFGSLSSYLTSQINIYDGSTFSCFDLGENPTLNSVLQVFGNSICSILSSISEITIPTSFSSDIVYFGGTQLSATINSIQSSIEDLENAECDCVVDIESITIGSVLEGKVPDCYTGTYTDESLFINLFIETMELLCDLTSGVNGFIDGEEDIRVEVMHDLKGMVFDDGSSDIVHSGSSFTVTIQNSTPANPSKYIVDGKYISKTSSNLTLDSLTMNYISITSAGEYEVVKTTIGDPVPPYEGLLLYTVETDGTGVADVTPNFTTYYLSGDKLPDSAIITRHIANGSVTSAKLADVVSAGTIGDANIFQLTVNSKGQITAGVSNITLTSLTDGDTLRWKASSSEWINSPFTPLALPSATDDQVLFYGSSAWNATSFMRLNNSAVSFGYNSSIEPYKDFHIKGGLQIEFGINGGNTPSGTLVSGGSLSATTTYYYSIIFEDAAGDLSPMINEVSVTTTGSDRTVRFDIAFPLGASSARLFRSTTSGTYSDYLPVSGPGLFTDNGTVTPTSGAIASVDQSSSMSIGADGLFIGVEKNALNVFDISSIENTRVSIAKMVLTGTRSIDGYAAILESTATNTAINYGLKSTVTGSSVDNVAIYAASGRVVIGGTSSDFNVNAALEITSTDKGLLLPRLTTTQRDAVTWGSDEKGMIIFNTTSSTFQGWDGSTWITL